MKDKLYILKNVIQESRYLVFFTGAGISVPSGIPDFRSGGGLYDTEFEHTSPEVILSHSYFMKYPKKFYKFYKTKMIYEHAKPNVAHETISALPNVKAVITQNIDGLHTFAGSQNVYELHGSIYRNHCMNCHRFYPLVEILSSTGVPTCECGGIIKPDVVLYEENLDSHMLEETIQHICNADLLIVVGSSLTVSPANSLLNYYRSQNLVIINKSPTPFDKYATLLIREGVEEVLTPSLLNDD